MMGKMGSPSVVIALKAARKSKQRGDYGEEKKEQAKNEVTEEWREKKNAEKPTGDEMDHQQMMASMHEKMSEMLGMMEQMMGEQSNENEGD